MLLSWVLFLSTIVLVPASETPLCAVQNGSSNSNTLYTSSVFESLHCHNDYKTHIRCSWTESMQMHEQAPLSLYHWINSSSPSPSVRETLCVPYGALVQLPGGRVTVRCRHNTGRFSLAVRDAFFFKIPCPPTLSKTVAPLQHVRLAPPGNLSQRAAGGGGALLKWQDPAYAPRSRPRPALRYQVSYRRSGQDWTEVQVSESELKMEAGSLVPDCEYEAKVRVREETGHHWSEWSPIVVWKTENVRGPARLQCVFDGQTEMHCSWEVRRELAKLITYRLSYRPNEALPAQWCSVISPLDAQPSGDAVLRFGCSFSVSDPEQPLLLELQPSYNAKVILSHKHIQSSPPDPVWVTEKDQDWLLSWTPPESPVPLSYQLRYWRTEEQESAEYLNSTEGARSSVIRGASLQASRRYGAQVRALTVRQDSYSGPPSEWSEPVEWTTHPASWSIGTLYIFIAVFVAMVFVILYLTLPACRRRLVLWKVSIPTPINSKVLEEIANRRPSAMTFRQKEMEKTLICSVQVLDKVCMSCYPEGCSLSQEPANGEGPGPCWVSAPEPDGCLSFSGPYILCPGGPPPEGDHFLSDAPSPSPPPAPPLAPPGAGGYVAVPPPQDGYRGSPPPVRAGYVAGPCAPSAGPGPLDRAPSEGSGRREVTNYVRLSETFTP